MSNHNQQKIKSIYQMLLELARGNLNFRITCDEKDSEFNELVMLLNNVAEKMQRADYSNPYYKSINAAAPEDESISSIIQKVQDYILNHLEEPLPSAKELSKIFGTNEFTLKEGFRNIAKTSIYQFYNDERLKKSHFLIESTLIPLKEVAYICGFNEYTNFYKAFKKKYNYSPSEINRIDKPETSE
ncbi:MAG: AraC family transcriptional regulator [Flavobacterium sp.]